VLSRQIGPDDEWDLGISRAVVAAGIIENGFYLWGPINRAPSPHPVIESDRVEGTAVYDPQGTQVGTIKRLLIEKVSGRVLYVDVTFGGFLGLGVHHHTVPWDKLSYDTELEGYRKMLDSAAKDKGYRVTMLAFLMKASVVALKEHPEFNASLSPEKDALIYKKYYHIGVAVDTPDGLVVPVIKDVDRKGILELSQELGAVSKKMRDGKISPADISGATFSISSLGGIGGTNFTPIVNAPELAILGVVRSTMKPVWDGKEFKPRLMLPLCLSYDHRVIDGALAARFTKRLADILGDVRQLVL